MGEMKSQGTNTRKIYFIENSVQFNSLDLNTTKIAGSEKTLINIANELGKNNFRLKDYIQNYSKL